MEEKVQKVLRYQGDTIHPLDVPRRRKIARAPDSLTVYHTTRLCDRLIQPKSEFDLTDPRGFLINSEYNCLHDPNLRGYLYRKDIHRRLLRGGFITKDDKVICSLRSLNRYRDHVAEVDKDWSRRFRMEQKEVVRAFLALQERGKISNEVTVSDMTDWILRSGKWICWNPSYAFRSRSMPGLRLHQLPAIAKRCSAIDVSPGRSEMMWSAKGAQMMEEVTKEVQREMRLQRRWVVGKMEREKKREELLQAKLRKAKKTSIPECNKQSLDRLSRQDTQLLPEKVEKRIGGHGEPSQFMHVSTSSPKATSPRGHLTTHQHERKDLELDVSPHGNLDHIFALTPDGRVRSSRQNSPERNISFMKQHPFSDAKKKLSAICQNLITRPSCSPRPASACGILCGKVMSTEQISLHLADLQQTLLENHFKGMVTSEELQVVLQGIVVTLVEEVNKVLIPAIVAFEHDRELATNSPKDFAFYDTSSSTTKISPVTSSSLSSTAEVHVTYPDYALMSSRGPSQMEQWSLSSPEDRRSLGKKVVQPTACLLLKVENLITDIIKNSVQILTAQRTQAKAMVPVNIVEDTEVETEPYVGITETQSEEMRVMCVIAERCHMFSPETTDTTTTDATMFSSDDTDATVLSSDATDDTAGVISNTTAPVTTDTIASTIDQTAVVIMSTTTAVTMDTIGATDQITVVSLNTATAVTADTFATTDQKAVVTLNAVSGDTMDSIGPANKTAVVTMNTTAAVTMDTTGTTDKSGVVTLNTATAITMDTIATMDKTDVTMDTTGATDKSAIVTLNTATAVTMDNIATMDKTDVTTMNTATTDKTAMVTLNATTPVTTDATTVFNMDAPFIDTESSSDSKLIEQLCEGIDKDSKQQFEAKDVMSDYPEISERESSHVTKEVDDDAEGSSTFVVSLEKSIQLSSDQVDEILEKVTCVFEEEWSCLLNPTNMPEDELEPASLPPNCVIFAIIQKMHLDKYLERKLLSFFARRQMGSEGSTSTSPSASPLLGAKESLSWNTLSEVNPHSIKVTKWLLQTIQRRNCWQGNMTSDLEEMDVKQMREKHLICEVIQALLDHLTNVSSMRSISRQTQSETDVCSLRAPMHADTVVSVTSLAASELTMDVMSKLVHEDN